MITKEFVREVADRAFLYRDLRTGLAWIEDTSTGCCISIHANIDASGSVRGMKQRGYWGKKDRTIRSHGFIYNIDSFICNPRDMLETVVADECNCEACIERRRKEEGK